MALALPRHGRWRVVPVAGVLGDAVGTVLAEQADPVAAAVPWTRELSAIEADPPVLTCARSVDAEAVPVAAVGAERVLTVRPMEAGLAVACALVA